jgi:hypothetical protein
MKAYKNAVISQAETHFEAPVAAGGVVLVSNRAIGSPVERSRLGCGSARADQGGVGRH